MPTTWNRSSEDFHKIYSANTDAFYRVGGIAMAKELDEFIFPQPAAAEMDALVTDKLRV